MSELSTNTKRAVDLTKVASQILTKCMANSNGNTTIINNIMSQYVAADISFITKTVEISSKIAALVKGRWNILKAFALLSALSGMDFEDPYKDQRNAVKAFCKEWLAFSGLSLTTYEQELID